MEDLIFSLLPYVLSFLVGLAIKSPFYKISKLVMKALEDDKLTEEEIRDIYEAFKPRPRPE